MFFSKLVYSFKVVKSFVRFYKLLCGCKSSTVRKSLRVCKTLSNVLSPPKTFKLVRVGQRTHLNCSAINNPMKCAFTLN